MKKIFCLLSLIFSLYCAYAETEIYFSIPVDFIDKNYFYKISLGSAEKKFFTDKKVAFQPRFFQNDNIVYITKNEKNNCSVYIYNLKTDSSKKAFEFDYVLDTSGIYLSEKNLYLLQHLSSTDRNKFGIVAYDMNDGTRRVVAEVDQNLIEHYKYDVLKFWFDEATHTMFINRMRWADYNRDGAEIDFMIVSLERQEVVFSHKGNIVLPTSCVSSFKNILFKYRHKLYSFDMELLTSKKINIDRTKTGIRAIFHRIPGYVHLKGNKGVIIILQKRFNFAQKILFGQGDYYDSKNFTFVFDNGNIVLKGELPKIVTADFSWSE